MTPWLLVAGDFMPVGGMDRANLALARYLANDPGVELHLVAHRAWHGLLEHGRVHLHRAWRPFDSHVLGAPLMARLGSRWARRLARDGVRVVVNGGNCPAGDVSWVHYVHAAYSPASRAGSMQRVKDRLRHRRDVVNERRTLTEARLVVCNSERTRRDVIERLRVPSNRTQVVYYGIDSVRFGGVTRSERDAARAELGVDGRGPAAVFIGALGDRRKGFDVLFEAWTRLRRQPSWDVDLLVVGSGAELPAWRRQAADAELGERVRFLGARADVDRVLAASDVLVHPARYEAYGLGVHEAICREVPAIVSADAGVAERYPADLRDLLIADPDDVDELVGRLRDWRATLEAYRAKVAPFAAGLRQRSWDDMARDLIRVVAAAA